MTTARDSRLARWLQALFNLQPGEGARVVVMSLYSAAAIGGVLTVGLTVSAALFVSELPAADMPYTIILPAIFIVPSLLVYNRIAARFSPHHVIIGSNALLLGGTALFRFLLEAPFGKNFAVLAALFLFIEVAYTLVILQFWSLAGQVFNPREAKRLFGLIGGGGTVANVLAGLSLASAARLVGVENLLWIVVSALGVCMACAWAVGRGAVTSPAATAPQTARRPTQKNFIQDLRAIRQSPLLLAIGGLTVLLSLLINIGAYQFYMALQINFAGRGSALAAYLGTYEFLAGLTALFVQFYLTSRVMGRFGVFAALLFFPLGMALGAGLSLLTAGAMWTVTLMRGADPAFRRTINSAALNVLYLPTPPGLRERAKELFEGLYAATFGIAGIVFLLLQRVPGWSFAYYSVPVLALIALWAALRGWTRRQYIRALTDSLKRRVLDLEGATINVNDETTVRVLTHTLRLPDKWQVLHALRLIAEAPAVDWDAHVAPLLAHPSVPVRLQALRHLGRTDNAGYAEAVAALFAAPEAEVRAGAVEAFCAIAGSAAIKRVGPFLMDDNPRVRSAVVAGLIRQGGETGFEFAANELNEMLGSGDPLMRHAAAHVLSLAPSADLQPLLVPLLDDADPEVRLEAVCAAGALNNHDLIPHLIRKLGDKKTALAAADALAQCPFSIEADLSAALDDPRLSAYIPHILQRRRTQAAVDVLLARFRVSDDDLRGRVFQALARRRAEGAEVNLLEATLREALLTELRGGYALTVMREDLGEEGLHALLADAFRVRLSRTLDRIFHLLNLLYPAHTQTIQRVRRALAAEQSNIHALAVELLDNLAEPQVRDLLLPLIEAPVERALDVARRRFNLERRSSRERLRELADGPDPWLRACAFYRIGMLRLTGLAGPVLAALEADDGLVRETALAARRQLKTGDGRLAPYLQSSGSIVGGPMPLSTVERVLFFKGAELLNQIPGEDLVPVAMVAQEVHFNAGEALIRQGDPGDCVYILVDGEASIVIRGVGQVATRRSGDSVGEMGLISRHLRSADCVALTDLTALRIDRDDFWELLAEKPLLALGVIRALSERLDEAVSNLQKLGQKPGEGE